MGGPWGRRNALDAGGEMTPAEFDRATNAIVSGYGLVRSPRVLISLRQLERGRIAARLVEVAADCAENELVEMSRWRWLRRRTLRRQILDRSRSAHWLRATFGWGL